MHNNLYKIRLVFLLILVCSTVTVASSNANDRIASNDLLGGKWCGSWSSCRDGHSGKLSASFCRIDANHVRARFRGNFAKIIPFRYNATLKIVHEEPGLIIMQGSQRLGPIMGTFSYRATVTGNRFSATYRSRKDWGTWRMSR